MRRILVKSASRHWILLLTLALAGPVSAAQAATLDNMPVQCMAAKADADWVLAAGSPARTVYDRQRHQGDSSYQAMRAAQAANPVAQQHLRACREWVNEYAITREQAN